MIELHSKVRKIKGYKFEGVVVADFVTIAGKRRIVVDNGDGLLHIFSPEQLELVEEKSNNITNFVL